LCRDIAQDEHDMAIKECEMTNVSDKEKCMEDARITLEEAFEACKPKLPLTCQEEANQKY
jgi:hypothetical protein